MADALFENVYNPDVLSCLANLSNDEVFTPPDVANAMLDMLPQELFSDPDATFLDPACKTGVFLREIAKRLIVGLEDKIPDLQERLDHIFHKQLYGIAITELTSLLSRRSLYCSKYPNGSYSLTKFISAEGNIRYKKILHNWKNGKCVYCGAKQDQFDREDNLDNHAYEWIHVIKPEDIFKMHFTTIIGNPPYQLEDGGNGISASPIYQLFIQQAKKLNPEYLVMIIPSRWYTGGKGLDKFRNEMLNDSHILRLVDYVNSKDCFPGMSVGGGVCYFLRDKNKTGECLFTNNNAGKSTTSYRKLNEFDVFIRYDVGLSIVNKARKSPSIIDNISTRNPFGIPSNGRGRKTKRDDDYVLYSKDDITYVSPEELGKNIEIANNFKIMISRFSAEHAGEPDKSGMVKVLSRTKIIRPKEICTDTYIVGGNFSSYEEAENFHNYLQTKFVRFLLLQSVSSVNITRDCFQFVPVQDFSKSWTDEDLYKKYGLSDEEINFIDSMIKPMSMEEGDNDTDK